MSYEIVSEALWICEDDNKDIAIGAGVGAGAGAYLARSEWRRGIRFAKRQLVNMFGGDLAKKVWDLNKMSPQYKQAKKIAFRKGLKGAAIGAIIVSLAVALKKARLKNKSNKNLAK